LNWKMFVTRHWKAILLMAIVGLATLAIITTKAYAEPIDSPIGP
jgi:hypothetical protein